MIRSPRKAANCERHSDRSAMTLIELISALAGATILMVAMAGTIAIATQQIETPIEASTAVSAQTAKMLIATDLRYATSTSSDAANTIELERPNPNSGASETITYVAGSSGLTRSTDGGTAVPILDNANTLQWNRSTTTSEVSPESPEIRAFTIGATESSTSSFSIDIPPGAIPGDLVILVAATRGAAAFSFGPETWTTYSDYQPSEERCMIATHVLTTTSSPSVVITASYSSPIAAAIICVDKAAATAPIKSHASNWGFTLGNPTSSYCPAGAPADLGAASLNLQVFTARYAPWNDAGLGIAGFSELGTVIANENSFLGLTDFSLGIACRRGPLPTTSTTPRVYSDATTWSYTALRVESL